MKISQNFNLHEFMPIHVYNRFGENSKWFIRPEIIKIAEAYRTHFGAPVTINNWFFGGRFQERGYRAPDSQTGGKYSQHKLGCAFDCSIKGITPKEVIDEILKNQKHFMSFGLTTLEHPDYTTTWIHSDIRTTNMPNLLIVKPAGAGAASIQNIEEYYENNNGKLTKIQI